MRAILIDSSPQSRELIRISLNFLGFTEIFFVADGDDAIYLLSSIPVNVLVVDCAIGLDAAKNIRLGAAGPQNAAAPILILTEGDEQRRLAETSGFHYCVAKPITFRQVKAALDKAVQVGGLEYV